MDKKEIKVLEKARELYGFRTQIVISAEECCELAKELLKYLRYDEHNSAVKETKDSVLSEVADVTIILNHIKAIFEISDEEIESKVGQKLERLSRWVNTGKSIEYTTRDRKLETKE